METVDEDFDGASVDFVDPRSLGQGRLCMVQLEPDGYLDSSSRPNARKTGLGIYPDGMVEHDVKSANSQELDDLGIANNMIVMYTTENGAENIHGPKAERRHSRREEHQLGGAIASTMVRWAGLVRHGRDQRPVFGGGLGDDAGRGGGRADIKTSFWWATMPLGRLQVHLDG